MNMPSKRKVPEFYQRITNPIDLGTIEQNIATGVYLTPESFNADMNRLFANYVRFYGRTNEAGVAAIKLKKVYAEAKQQSLPKFENVLGKKPPPNFVKNKGSRSKGVSSTVCSRRGIFFVRFRRGRRHHSVYLRHAARRRSDDPVREVSGLATQRVRQGRRFGRELPLRTVRPEGCRL
jgi:hypothetical protein